MLSQARRKRAYDSAIEIIVCRKHKQRDDKLYHQCLERSLVAMLRLRDTEGLNLVGFPRSERTYKVRTENPQLLILMATDKSYRFI